MPFHVAVVLADGFGDPLLGVAARLGALLRRQQRLGGAVAVFQLRGRPRDQAVEHVRRLRGVATLGEDLAALQLVVVAAPAFVVLAVVLLAIVDPFERGGRVAFGEGELDEMVEMDVAVGGAGERELLDEGGREPACQLAGVEPQGGAERA